MLKKVMEDGVLWGLAVGLHVVRTVKDTPTLNTGNVQLSMVEDSFPETTLNIIYDFLQPIQQFDYYSICCCSSNRFVSPELRQDVGGNQIYC